MTWGILIWSWSFVMREKRPTPRGYNLPSGSCREIPSKPPFLLAKHSFNHSSYHITVEKSGTQVSTATFFKICFKKHSWTTNSTNHTEGCRLSAETVFEMLLCPSSAEGCCLWPSITEWVRRSAPHNGSMCSSGRKKPVDWAAVLL